MRSITGILLAAICITSHAAELRKVPLEVFASSAEIGAYPIEIGMPFPPGTLSDAAQIRLLSPEVAEISHRHGTYKGFAGSKHAIIRTDNVHFDMKNMKIRRKIRGGT